MECTATSSMSKIFSQFGVILEVEIFHIYFSKILASLFESIILKTSFFTNYDRKTKKIKVKEFRDFSQTEFTCSKLTIQTLEQNNVFIVDFENFSHLILVLLLLRI